jgi:hypothetical protein
VFLREVHGSVLPAFHETDQVKGFGLLVSKFFLVSHMIASELSRSPLVMALLHQSLFYLSSLAGDLAFPLLLLVCLTTALEFLYLLRCGRRRWR